MRIRIVKSVLAASLLLAFTVTAVHAQQSDANGPQSGGPPPNGGGGPHGTPPTPAQELDRLSQALTLTDAQKSAILPILEKRQAAMQQLISSSTDRSALREQMDAIRTSSNAEIRAQLTETQQPIFDKMEARRGPGGGGPRGGNSSDSGGPPQ